MLRADASQHGDLFWALRGGGGNFGVVTAFDFTAEPVDSVHFGTIGYQPGDLSQLIASWRDLMRVSDDNLTTALTLMPPMPGQPASATMMCCYADRDGAGAGRALGPFRRLGPVIRDDIQAVPYREVLEDARQLAGLRIVIRNIFVRALGDRVIALVEALFRAGSAVVSLRSLGGAAARVPADATAFAHRNAEAMLVATFVLPADAPGQFDDVLARWEPLAAHGTGAYVNFLGSATETDVAAAYPPTTYRRLAAVKRAYDPGNVFHRNHNIPPAATRELTDARVS